MDEAIESPVDRVLVVRSLQVAESAVILVEYGGVPEFLQDLGYGPGGKNPSRELRKLRKRR